MGETNTDKTNFKELDAQEKTKNKYSHKVNTYSKILFLLFKYLMFFKSKWVIFIQIAFSAIIILFELIFRFTNELYRERPVNIFSSIFTPILMTIGLAIFLFTVRFFLIIHYLL